MAGEVVGRGMKAGNLSHQRRRGYNACSLGPRVTSLRANPVPDQRDTIVTSRVQSRDRISVTHQFRELSDFSNLFATRYIFTTRKYGVVMCSVTSVCLSVCLSAVL